MKYTYVLWDFNGTILNDVEVGIKSTNIMLKKRGLNKIHSVKEYYDMFCFPIIDYYKKLGFDFEKECFEDLSVEWVEHYLFNVKEAVIFDGAVDLMKKLKNNNITQIILSATEQKMLENQIEGLGIREYFNEIIGLDNIYAFSKVGAAEKWISDKVPRKILMLGDTYHDYEVAKTIGIDIILIANGHQSKKQLEKCDCIIVDDIRQVNDILEI